MFDDFNSERPAESSRRIPPRGDSQRPLADREVPLERAEGLAAPLHAWLDGELPEAAARKAGGTANRDVEFWRTVSQETERFRHMRTPAHVADRIMGALPQTAPAVITPWFRREFVVTPAVALGTAALLVAVAATATVILLQVMQ
jgi:hypothetical protein